MGARQRGLLAPLLLLALVALGICVHVAMLAPPLWDEDEKAHAGYALAVLHGDLPTIDTPILDEPDHFPQLSSALQAQHDQAHRDIWTANHPPLYYLISAPVLGVADALDVPGAGFLGMRLLNALGMAATVLLVGLLAAELLPDRPEVAVLAAAVAAGCPTVMYLGGLILNDGLAAAASTAALLVAVRALREGPTRGRIAWIAVFGTAAAAFRAPGVLAVIACTVAVLLAGLRHGHSRWRSVGLAAIAGGVPALGIGWFYLRNIHLYGDVGATAALLTKFHRHGRGSLLHVALSRDLYVTQFQQLWVRGRLGKTALINIPTVIAVLVGLGLLVAVIRARRIRPADSVPWLVLIGYSVAIQVTVVEFYQRGGMGHVRYLIPSLPLLGTAAAVGLLAFVGRRAQWPATAVFSGLALAFAAAVQDRSSRVIFYSHQRIPGLTQSTVGGAAPWVPLVVAGLAAVAVLVILLYRSVRALPPVVRGGSHRREAVRIVDPA